MLFFVHLWLVFPTQYVLIEGNISWESSVFQFSLVLSTAFPQLSCLMHVCVHMDLFQGHSACAVGNAPLSFGRIKSLPNQTFLFQLTGDRCPKGLELNLSRADYKPAQTTEDYIDVHVALGPPESWHKAGLRLPESSPKKTKQGFRPSVPRSGDLCLQCLSWHCIN